MRAQRWLAVSMILAAVAFVGVNGLAYQHAKAMTHFSSSGPRTGAPEHLGTLQKLRVLLTGVNFPRPVNSQTPEDFGLTFTTHRYPNRGGDSIEAWHVPGREPGILVLLFHGYAASKASLLPIAAELNKAGYSTFLVDFYGSGGSSGNGTTIGMLEAHDVTASLDHARVTWPDERCVLYGLSMGGAAVMRSIAVDGARPDGVIVEAVFDRMVSTVKNRFHLMGIPAEPLTSTLVFWGGRQFGGNAFEHNPADYAESVDVPTLVLHGSRDERVTTAQAMALYDHLRGWKRFSEYPEAGHAPVVTADPVRWRRDVEELLHMVAEGT